MPGFFDLPRDSNGIIEGKWVAVHRSPEFDGLIGPVLFERGRSVEPLEGAELRHFAANAGPELDFQPHDGKASKAQVRKDPPRRVQGVPVRVLGTDEQITERFTTPPTGKSLADLEAEAEARLAASTQERKYSGVPPIVPEADRDEVERLKHQYEYTSVRTALAKPAEEPSGDGDDLEALGKSELLSLAFDLDLEPSRSWGAPRLRKLIREKRAEAS